MWDFIADSFISNSELWRLLIVSLCVAVCAFFPRRGFRAARDVPLFLLYLVCVAAVAVAVDGVLIAIAYAAGGNIYLRMVDEYLYALIVFLGAMAVCGRMKTWRRFVICLSFVAAYVVVAAMYAIGSAYYEYRTGLPGSVWLVGYALLLGFSVVYARLPLDEESLSRGALVLLGVMDFAVIVYAMVMEVYMLRLVEENGYGRIDFTMLAPYALFFCLVVLLYISMHFICREREARERAVRETEAVRSTESMVRFAEADMAQVREMRHDLKNQAAYMDVLLKKGDLEELGRVIEELAESVASPSAYIDCGNVQVSAVLSVEYVKARSNGIELVRDVAVPASLPFEGGDICAIISNMCDNAMESDLRHGTDDPVEICIGPLEGALCIRVTNVLPEGADAGEALSLRTHKENGKEHGMGTRIIRRLAEKYGGYANFDVEDGRFVAEAVLPLGAGDSEQGE